MNLGSAQNLHVYGFASRRAYELRPAEPDAIFRSMPLSSTRTAASRDSSGPENGARKILFVEDGREEREAAIVTLRERGYVVVEATDGVQAVRYAAKESPDVVVLDVSLPVMDGIAAIRRIRALGAQKRPHVIVISGQVDARTRQLAFEAGCDQYIVKPCPTAALAGTVDAYFVKRDGRQ